MDFTEIEAKLARAACRKEKRLEKRAGLPWGKDKSGSKSGGKRPPKKKRKKTSARKLVFTVLRRLCKEFVMIRSGGQCEIAMSCCGDGRANTWYHGWPQKGGNGLKYDVRSHFYSCGACNMGEYGARMRGDDRYEVRHKEILGEALWLELDALHGRRSISTAEARSMGDDLATRLAALKGEADIPKQAI